MRVFIIAIAVGLVTADVSYVSADSREEGEENGGKASSARPPTPRRPTRGRPDAGVTFPSPVLPRSSIRSEREPTRSLDAFLGPIPKEVVVAEGASLAAMQRVLAIPNTRLRVAAVRGNTLAPEHTRRLERLDSVSIHLRAPIEPVHIEVLERLETLGSATVTVPHDRAPQKSLTWRLRRLGPRGRHVELEGEPTVERLAPLSEMRSGTLTVDLPDGGIDGESAELLGSLNVRLQVRVPPAPSPEALDGLRKLSLARVLLETDGNRLRGEVLESILELDTRVGVILDRRLTREDLRRLKGVPKLELLLWLADTTVVPEALTSLLAETEGARRRADDDRQE